MDIELPTIERSSKALYHYDKSNTISKTSAPKTGSNDDNDDMSNKFNIISKQRYVLSFIISI